MNDLALRLTGERDLAAVLQESVTQARRLMDANVAYLALCEPDDSLIIQVTDGSTGPRLRGVRLMPHSGLAGRVIDQGEPVQTADYLNDINLTHIPLIDETAADEGLRTIVGVPVRLRGNVIGVLLVAQRELRSFSDQELGTLTAIASLAAVAIDNARQIANHRKAADELSVVNADLQQHIASVTSAASLHDHLLQVALRGGGVEQVLLGLSEVVSGLITYFDDRDVAVSAAHSGQVKQSPGVIELDGRHPSQRFAAQENRHTWAEGSLVTVPIASAQVYFGCLQLSPHGAITEWDLRQVERAAMTIGLVAAADRAMIDANQRSVTELLEQLVSQRIQELPSFERTARSMGLDVMLPHTVVVLDPNDQNAFWTAAQLRELADRDGGLAGRLAGRLVAIIRAEVDLVREYLVSRQLGTAGLGSSKSGVAGLAEAYQDAVACLAALHALNRTGIVATPSDLGPYRFLLSRAGRNDAERFVQSTIGPIIEYDQTRHTDLVNTADSFLSNGRRHAATATKLHIHANTLYQRLDQIAAHLGESWRDGDHALEVQMALRMHRLIGDWNQITIRGDADMKS
ncbi:MAG: GAF domain-containing protein [Nakamurella sp.]